MTDRETELAEVVVDLREEISARFQAATFYEVFAAFNRACVREARRQRLLAIEAMRIASNLVTE